MGSGTVLGTHDGPFYWPAPVERDEKPDGALARPPPTAEGVSSAAVPAQPVPYYGSLSIAS